MPTIFGKLRCIQSGGPILIAGPSDVSAFSEARPLVSRVERNRGLGRAFEKAVRRKPLVRRTRSLCKLNGSEGEVLELGGVGTEAQQGARQGVGARVDG